MSSFNIRALPDKVKKVKQLRKVALVAWQPQMEEADEMEDRPQNPLCLVPLLHQLLREARDLQQEGE
jgi:hypothetical protein